MKWDTKKKPIKNTQTKKHRTLVTKKIQTRYDNFKKHNLTLYKDTQGIVRNLKIDPRLKRRNQDLI